MGSSSAVVDGLTRVTAGLPGGEDRPGQQAMARAVASAIDRGRHLVVQAGTGVGKSLAYLVPSVQSGRRVVVATATKALQDQLATKELPLLARELPMTDFTYAVLKGRSNYLCRQRAAEIGGSPVLDTSAAADPLVVDADGAQVPGDEPARTDDGGVACVDATRFAGQLRRVLAWAERSVSGDCGELDFEPHPRVWASVSIGARECPGAYRCPSGPNCFAEQARAQAAAADVVVVNTHLYATHVASGGGVLPDHDVLVLDEVHEVEDVMTAGLGVDLAPGRLRVVAQTARALLGASAGAADTTFDAAGRLEEELRRRAGRRVRPEHDRALAAVLELARGRVGELSRALRAEPPSFADDDDDTGQSARRQRALLAAGNLVDDLDAVLGLDDDHVAWVEVGGPAARAVSLKVAPVDVGPVLADALWPKVTAVLTSATVPAGAEVRLGLPSDDTDRIEVESPFPYEDCALLYCASHLPDRRHPDAEVALHHELADLVTAAGGRTLALFTSWRAMRGALDALRPALAFPVLGQSDLPKAKLLDAFAGEESACLFATMSFWQGVDVPGATLSLVAIDRLPFARPDDPLLAARRDRAGAGAFAQVDLPRAATHLAQGAGRLIRTRTDRGVVAVLDRRLAVAGYRRVLLDALPPMRFTTDRREVLAFLRSLSPEPGPRAPDAAADGRQRPADRVR